MDATWNFSQPENGSLRATCRIAGELPLEGKATVAGIIAALSGVKDYWIISAEWVSGRRL